ncbi:MAG: ATP-binding cassette domain-containing protein [Spirochaetes bacterium]|nr:ATP-binding cassette domain-containing protein [Spirochaetota bacterium]MBU0955305.1 ATP-binding cassette domain-containing protein [Spirochaetota bacterium]
MAILELTEACKTYRIVQRQDGISGALKNLFVPRYRDIQAVKRISFAIEAGEMVGFIGPNGAGKSTTIKLLTGVLVPTSGRVQVLGLSPFKDRKRYVGRIGVVFGQRTQLWWDLPVSDTFDLLRKIYGVPPQTYRRNLELFDDILGLADFRHQLARQLSLGQRMRADIAAALLHDPELVFLDEPTIGLDIVAKDKIRGFMQHINAERGVTMLLTSHDMQDMERTCQRVIVIDKGALLYDGSVSGLASLSGSRRSLIVDFNVHTRCEPISGTELIQENALRARFSFDRGSMQVHELVSQVAKKYDIADMTIEEPSIESVVKTIFSAQQARL